MYQEERRKNGFDYENICLKVKWFYKMQVVRRMEIILNGNSLGSLGFYVEGDSVGQIGRFGMFCERNCIDIYISMCVSL